jgi:glycosyltransferase involved in cell wall biosynthesis
MMRAAAVRIAPSQMPLARRRPESVMSPVPTLRQSLDIGVFGARGIPSTYSGYETFLTVMLPELVARGHRVTMYCRRGEVEPVNSYRGVRCVVLPSVRSKQLSTLTHGYIAAGRAAAARHDVLLVVNVGNAGACLISRLLGSRVVLNTDGQEWNRLKWGRVGRSVFLASAHMARHAAAALVADSAAMQDIYRRRFGAESTVIPYCWTEIEPAPPEELASFGLEPRKYFVVAGRLTPENNADAIAEAYVATDLPYPLLVLGKANYRSPVSVRLAELARRDSRVVVGGHVGDRRQFALVLREALGYIHGHSVGGINPVLIEAMGCGARIAALETPFNREALGDCGDYFSDPASDLAAALDRIVSEPTTANDARRADGRHRAHGRFSRKAVADAYELLLATAARRDRRSGTSMPTQWDRPE